MSWVYLQASLETLDFDQVPSEGLEILLERVLALLGPEAASRIAAFAKPPHLALGPQTQAWADYWRSLMHELALERKKRLKRLNAETSTDAFPLAPMADLEEILHADNPLNGQINYLQLLFNEAEHLAWGLEPGPERLALYALCLGLVEERQSYQAAQGQALAKAWMNQHLNDGILHQAFFRDRT